GAGSAGEGEVDLVHLTRRAMRVADPAAAARSVTLTLPPVQAPSVVVADQHLVWSVIDAVLFLALASVPRGGSLMAAVEADGAGVVVRFAADGVARATAAQAPADLAAEREEAARLAAGAGILLTFGERAESFDARLSFPAERCLAMP
ncbi:MAG: hypothetical protein AAF698_12610, partial [Pseudomonadota bacterium]